MRQSAVIISFLLDSVRLPHELVALLMLILIVAHISHRNYVGVLDDTG